MVSYNGLLEKPWEGGFNYEKRKYRSSSAQGLKNDYRGDYFVSKENSEDDPLGHLCGAKRELDLLMRFGHGGLADFLVTDEGETTPPSKRPTRPLF
ncbi:hypothetical protein ACLOJK_015062 [Asimina triloba]